MSPETGQRRLCRTPARLSALTVCTGLFIPAVGFTRLGKDTRSFGASRQILRILAWYEMLVKLYFGRILRTPYLVPFVSRCFLTAPSIGSRRSIAASSVAMAAAPSAAPSLGPLLDAEGKEVDGSSLEAYSTMV